MKSNGFFSFKAAFTVFRDLVGTAADRLTARHNSYFVNGEARELTPEQVAAFDNAFSSMDRAFGHMNNAFSEIDAAFEKARSGNPPEASGDKT